ncbi:MAG TPA: DUF1501 domain-containing protein [Verrucomicrobiales bacterium]|nr:DUF1501 domain-containing protein [Verrucomicrobiales bacterium]
MIRVLGTPRTACDGLTRREMLRIGGLSLLGLNLPGLLRAEQTLPTLPGRSTAKSVILLYLFGGPAAQETFDPKTEAPAEYRGAFGSIPTSVPGVRFCEYLPRMAKWMNRSTLIRSFGHESNDHSAGLLHTLSGMAPERLESLVPILASQAPGMSAVIEYLARGEKRTLPASVWMPCYPGWGQQIYRPGPYGGFLGRRFDPWFTSCRMTETYEAKNFYDTQGEPVGHITVPATELTPGLTVDRLNHRASLAEQFDRQLDQLAASDDFARHDHYQRRALEILSRPGATDDPWKAFDLSRESPSLRDRYGRHLYGEAALTARRLVERGVRFVTVAWESFEKQGSEPCSWDTHERHFPIMKDYHLPTLDQVYTALCEDLEARGLLDETLVVVMGEMGRAPKVNAAGGRDHWSYLQNVLLTGAGVQKGLVYGSSDDKGFGPTSHPVSPGDLISTIYAAMGIDTGTFMHDFTGRPRPMVPDGSPLKAILT